MEWWQIALIGFASGVAGVAVLLYVWHAIQEARQKVTTMLLEIDRQGYERGLAEGLGHGEQGAEPESD